MDEKNTADTASVAATALKDGAVIAYPTETFYGIGAKFDLESSLKKLCRIKNRPSEKALPLVIGTTRALSLLTDSVPARAQKLIDAFWPGPLTILFKARSNLSAYLTAGTGKVAVRVPGESFALLLARKSGFPVTATSANPSGLPAASDAATVIRYFDDLLDIVIDGGITHGGLPSTIVDAAGERIQIIREGAVAKESLKIMD
jgi:L-threonylcarbamoyladenylate synthase